MKVNTDDKVLSQPGMASCGGIFCNSRGSFHGAFSCKLGATFAFEAKLVGAMTAISIAFLRGRHRLWIESDSTYVVALMKFRSSKVPW